MDYAPDSVLSTTFKFITDHVSVFPSDASLLPSQNENCSLVAVSPKYGLVFAALGTTFKVYQSQALLADGGKKDVATVDTGAPITHLVASCDGLTLMAVVIHGNIPHALFYECRNFVHGCANQTPFASTAIGQVGGSRVQGIAWNPMVANNVAVATSPGSLSIILLKDNCVDVKTVEIKACAVGWSPKGKQLTVGLTDGSLALFKPDLTPVRNIARPPMEELGAVLSITWFTSTEFFIGYKQEAEEGGHVMMFISAPKGKEPKYVLYEFLCNDNQGPRPPMFYPVFITEWSVMCVLSSRAVQLGVLGKAENGGEGWCEYEMEEGSGAGLHNISVTKETYALGMAVDFTSLKSFTHKDGSTSGPCPVLYALSTGGELNIFHFVNNAAGAPVLTKMAEALPNTGHRTPDQFPGVCSYVVPASTTSSSAAPPDATPKLGSVGEVSSSPSMFKSMAPTSSFGAIPFQQTATAADKPQTNFSFSQGSGSNLFGNSGGTSLFGKVQQQAPMTLSKPSATPAAPTTLFQQASTSAATASSVSSSTPMSSLQFKAPTTKLTPQLEPSSQPGFMQPQPSDPARNVSTQGVNLTNVLPKADSGAGSISQGKPAFSSTPLKSKSPTPVMPVTPKSTENQIARSSQSPASPLPTQKLGSGKRAEPDLMPAIMAITSNFEKEFSDHLINNQCQIEIGKKEEMGKIRSSLVEQKTWIDQMSSTTAELKAEVMQLHSKVLEGYTLREEAEGQLQKRKNPRHLMSLQSRPLDPQSRRRLEEIRSRYQYLQSQLTEVNTRLHLDWAEFTNAASSKKKKELPASETLYHALLKSHSFRVALDKQFDVLCEKVKALQLHSLSGSLQGTYQDDEEIFASLEKSMRETSLSSSMRVSPVKMLPPEKQDRLQKLLAQRTTVPVKKCTSVPRMNLTSLQNSTLFNDSSNLPNSSSLLVNHSVSSPALDFTLSSFGPQTFSTPNRKNTPSPVNSLGAKSEALQKSVDFGSASESRTSSPFSSVKQTANIPNVPATKDAEVAALRSNKTGFSFTAVPSIAAASVGSVSLGKVQYEDITPPQTPSVKLEDGAKSASPLLALSSMVSKVPSTTPNGTNLSNTVSLSFDTASSGLGTASLTDSNKITVSSAQSSLPSVSSAFSFKGASSSPSAVGFSATAASGSSLSLPSTCAVVTTVGSTATTTSPPSFGASFSFKPPTASTNLFSNVIPSSASSSLPSVSSSTNTLSFSAPSSVLTTTTASLFSKTSLATETGTPSLTPQTTSSIASATVASSGTEEPSTTSTAPLTVTPVAAGSTPASLGSNTLGGSGPASSGSLFGNSSAPAAGSIFSGGAAGTGTSMFGGPSSTPAKLFGGKTATSSSLFGGTTATTTLTTTASTSSADTTASSSAASIFSNKTATTKSSIFSGAEPTNTGSLFSNSSSTTTQSGSLFGGTAPSSSGSLFSSSGSLFGGTSSVTIKSVSSPVSTVTSTNTTSTASIFSNSSTLSGSSLFLPPSTVSGSSSATTSSGSMFAAPTSPSPTGSLFGSPAPISSAPGISSAPTTSGSLFSGTASSGSLFSSTTPSTAASGGIFGTAASDSSSSGALFSSPTTASAAKTTPVSSVTGSVFGGGTSASASTGSLFGSPAVSLAASGSTVVTSSSGGMFGTAAVAPSSSGSLFGSTSPATSSVSESGLATTSSGSVFGTAASATSSSGSLFGSAAPSSSTSTFGASAFGALTTSSSGSAFSTLNSSTGGFSLTSATTTTASGSVFGQTSPQVTNSVFGQSPQSPSSSSVFGSQSTNAPGSVFGSQPTTSTGSVFGSQPTTSTGSVFGSQPTTATGSVFGSSSQGGSVFGSSGTQSSSPFGGSALSQTTGGSVFGQPITSSGFGSGTSGSVFGQTPSQGASPFNAKSSDNSSSSVFGSSAFGSGSGGGSGLFSGLGGKPSQENANKNVFGSLNFGEAKPQSSLFSGGTNQASSTFGGMTFGGSANNGANSTFSSPVGQAVQSGFGTATPQKSSFGGGGTFGGASAFGAAPVFGSPPKFGSSPAFGGSPTFGSSMPTSTANTSSGGAGFGAFASSGGTTFGTVGSSAPTNSSGFGNFAAQNNAASFGSVAQQQSTGGTFGGGNSFASGSSFSSWR
ncbi:nuclear pore complex protein DDB_G0274915-like isoform X3 [Penaeus japonicus]|uniref:nuclear pore complex protein DDB_G0274915-like isoform X3 n=1 Tax=Penaeus japonicus TaxID=27405 RepID=UPI001C70F269|nr:nuclear pore complex protein DDB_G0274915-like isoform X3 [Penaeus japonicus]